MLEESLGYPRRGGWGTILIGGLLVLFGFLIIPLFVVYGYIIRVLRSAALGEEMPPRFEDWGSLLVDGFKAFVIGVAYVIVPYVVVFVGLVGGLFALSRGTEMGIVVGVVLVLLGLGGFVALFGVAYVVPVALTNFALEGRLSAAFAFRTIIDAALTRDYVVAVLLSIGVGIVVGFVFYMIGFVVQIGIITVITVVGLGGGDPSTVGAVLFLVGGLLLLCFAVVFVFVGFYVQIITYYLLGRGCGATLVDESSAVGHATD